MARWATTQKEIEHHKKVGDQIDEAMAKGTILGFQMRGGITFVGLVEGGAIRNNAGESGPFKIQGEVRLTTADGRGLLLDYLDIEFAFNSTSDETLDEFKKVGLL